MTVISAPKKRAPRGIKIRSPDDVRILMNRLINGVIRGTTHRKDLVAIVSAARVALKCFEATEFKERLEELERRIKLRSL